VKAVSRENAKRCSRMCGSVAGRSRRLKGRAAMGKRVASEARKKAISTIVIGKVHAATSTISWLKGAAIPSEKPKKGDKLVLSSRTITARPNVGSGAQKPSQQSCFRTKKEGFIGQAERQQREACQITNETLQTPSQWEKPRGRSGHRRQGVGRRLTRCTLWTS